MTVISKNESKVFYGVSKTTKVATTAEVHEAIKGSRNVVVLLPNASDSGNQDSNKEEVSVKGIEEIYKPVKELDIEDLESDDEAELPLPTLTTRQELPRSEVGELFSQKAALTIQELAEGQCLKICNSCIRCRWLVEGCKCLILDFENGLQKKRQSVWTENALI